MSFAPEEGKMWTPIIQIMQIYRVIPSARDSKVRTVEIKYFNYPSRKPKYSIVDVRKLSLIPNLS